MGTEDVLYFLALALLAEVIGTLGGFGSSLFFVPIASYFFDFRSVLGITALFHVTSNLSKIALFKRGFDKRLVVSLGLPAIAFVILGAWLSKYIDTRWLEVALSVFLISLSLALLLVRNAVIQPTILNSFIGGSVSGLLAGLVGTGGAIRGATLAAFQLKKEVFIATSAIIDLGIDTSRGAVYLFQGYVQAQHVFLIPLLMVTSIVGTFIGKKILERFSEAQFKTVVLLLILATGIYTLMSVLM